MAKQHFNIWIRGAGALDGTYRDAEATTARAALNRIIGKPYQPGMTLKVNDLVQIEIRRWS